PPATELYTPSLHDALPIWIGFYLTSPCHRQATWEGTRERIERMGWGIAVLYVGQQAFEASDPPDPAGPIICSRTLLTEEQGRIEDRKSTRLNSSHVKSSYA